MLKASIIRPIRYVRVSDFSFLDHARRSNPLFFFPPFFFQCAHLYKDPESEHSIDGHWQWSVFFFLIPFLIFFFVVSLGDLLLSRREENLPWSICPEVSFMYETAPFHRFDLTFLYHNVCPLRFGTSGKRSPLFLGSREACRCAYTFD